MHESKSSEGNDNDGDRPRMGGFWTRMVRENGRRVSKNLGNLDAVGLAWR
jgi:hypothetical protein